MDGPTALGDDRSTDRSSTSRRSGMAPRSSWRRGQRSLAGPSSAVVTGVAVRRLDPVPIDDSTRPRVAGSVELTPRQRQAGDHLRMVHDHFRAAARHADPGGRGAPRRRGRRRRRTRRPPPAGARADRAAGLGPVPAGVPVPDDAPHHRGPEHVPGRRDPGGVRPGGHPPGRGAPRHPRPPRARRRPRRGRTHRSVAGRRAGRPRSPTCARTSSRTSPTRRPR